jgi:hypothetical protein
MSRSRDCAISTSTRFVPNGTTFWVVWRPFSCRVLLFRMVAYRLQADRFGDLDPQSKRALDGAAAPEKVGQNATPLAGRLTKLKAGTTLGRELNGRMHRVSVLADGFAYDGKTYSSSSKIAFAITGTRWNGPRFTSEIIGQYCRCTARIRQKHTGNPIGQ